MSGEKIIDWKNIVVGVLLICGISVGLVICSMQGEKKQAVREEREEERQRQDDIIAAYTMAQEFVKDRLKSPGSAEFPWHANSYVTALGNNRFRVKAYVDSQNVFGALIRTNFDLTLRREGERWMLESIEFEE